MALFNEQQQEEQQNQLQQYGVQVGARRIRSVQRVPYVPDMNIGRPLFRARQLPAYPVREQQHVMLQDRISQDVQHNMQQDNIAYLGGLLILWRQGCESTLNFAKNWQIFGLKIGICELLGASFSTTASETLILVFSELVITIL